MSRILPISQHPSTKTRRVLHTFDIFDTLIARRCIDAKEVFHEVERRSGIEGFALARQEAERLVYHREYDFTDIYLGLTDLLSLNDEQAEALMHIEVEVELENVVPIVAMRDKLSQESLLITDMYLPLPVIRELLARAGITRDHPILISSHGKSGGLTWRYFADQGIQCLHHGDNERSDVLNARQEGMRARLVRNSNLTEFEAMLSHRGAVNAARVLRAARLQVNAPDMAEWQQRLQFNVNLPFLLISTLDLMSEVREQRIEKVLFASRDGRHLQSAFIALRDQLPDLVGVDAQYWYTSRVARTSDSISYEAYCRQMLSGSERVALVDLCGTGASLTKLLNNLSIDSASVLLYLAQKVSDKGYSDHMATRYGLGTSDDLSPVRYTFDTGSYINNSLLEQLNYVPEGMVRDVMVTPFGTLPLRDDVDFDGPALDLVNRQNQWLTGFFDQMRSEMSQEAMAELIQVAPFVREWMILHSHQLSRELEVLRVSLGIDDLSNENFTQRDLVR